MHRPPIKTIKTETRTTRWFRGATFFSFNLIQKYAWFYVKSVDPTVLTSSYMYEAHVPVALA